ncbi:MAG: cadherin-like beta sandwich domain-containing protein [Gemmatimonadetes bacterium]|nr:cadherin-like beta sandwich domain-containing protein [Gemmatimonadota bacterium]
MGEINGQVLVENEGIDGVSVTLSSGAATTTSGGGHFSFMDVEGGTYTVTISGYPDDASFDATTAEVTIATSGQTAGASFKGSWIRTATLTGMVTVEGTGLPGITVSISGREEDQMLTDDNGQYTFTGLRAGNYTVEITGFDATDVAFSATSSTVEVSVAGWEVWSFDGTFVRESTIAGQVIIEGNGLSDVTVSLQGMGAEEDVMTDDGGQYTFSNLRAGEYQLAISGYDTNEYGFSTTSATVRVEHGRTANVPFEGIMLRTATIMGQVSVEGEGLADVTVSLSGEGESLTTMTDNSGQYAFSDLPAGNFQVGISGYDTDDFSFEATSKNVALALGETATVPFEGILLRTSGISGRVSVEGDGLDSVTVTLSGDDLEEDMETMTDATGQYAIAGLAEGDYTVAISGYDDVSYDFETTSMDVTLGDDDTQIVNFMGTHDRTASLSVMMFVDEAGKNDAYDDGESGFPTPQMLAAAAQLGVPLDLLGQLVTLAGPGVLDTQSGTVMRDGTIVFSELKAGQYQLIVSNIPAAALAALPAPLANVLRDYAYGGPATGYPQIIAVGQQASQNVPFDITHTTVNFGVTLKAGENRGAPLPGATVTLYSDAAGELKITDGMTGVTGGAAIRIARAGTSGNTVYAAVAAPEGSYHTSGMMQPVPWDPKYPATVATNAADIVNLKADFSFSGVTITTDFGGGKALGGWAITIGSDKSAAADTPDKLGADGSESYSEVVMADSLPVTYTVKLASNQDNTLDGGESYKADSLMHTHTGLSLPAKMDAGMLQAQYTTQTLKVYVHHERDQVTGYTGNILGGDVRNTGTVDVDIRHIERSSGRSRAFNPNTEWNSGGGRYSNANGVVTFRRVPANAQVIVQASLNADAGNVRLLRPDELATYTDVAGNGIEGGAFGDNGGYHHTVELCPLKRTDPTGQRFGDCASFAFVSTHLVYGQVWKHAFYPASSGDGWTEYDLRHVPGTSVTLAPVDGENLAGDGEGFTAASRNAPGGLDERKQFSWGQKAAGVYKVTPTPGWVVQVGTPHNAVALGSSLNPLAGDLQLDVTPTTGFVYGRVTGSDGFAVADVTVHVNGVTVTTDEFGRYYAEGFGAQTRTINRVRYVNKIFVETNHEGHNATNTLGEVDFAANTPMEVNVTIAGSTETATISGKVTAAGTGNPVKGARIWVDYGNGATNPQGVSARTGLLTGDDGTYSATVVAQPAGTTVAISATKSDMSFTPASHSASAIEGSAISGIDFTGFLKATISGRVVADGGGPMSGVTLTAAQVGGSAADTAVTSVTGTYSLRVPFGSYDVEASKDGYNFAPASQRVNVGPGESKPIDDFQATAISSDAMLSALSLSAGDLSPTFVGDVFAYTASVGNDVESTTVTATANDAGAGVAISPDDADDATDGHQIDLDVGDNEITVTVTAANGGTADYTVTVTRAASSDNSLSALSLSDVTLTPAFASDVFAYTADVANEIASTTVEATANDADNASVSIAPADASMLEMGHQVNLDVGDNVITVTVTAADGTTQDYTVTVTRPISTDATLSALSLDGITFSPMFASGTTAYTATAGYDDAETTVDATASHSAATMAIVPADADATADGHQVALSVGSNVITVRVTAEDGTTQQDYTVSVTRDGAPSSDATLSALTLSGVDLTFDPATTDYTASVGNDVDETTVTALQTHSSASVAISPADADADAANGHQVALGVGDTEITVTVRAENGAEEEYTVTVTRAMSSDATLGEVTVNGGMPLEPDASGNYAAEVEYEIAVATIVTNANSSAASVVIVPDDADDAADGHQVALNVGDNAISVVVYAQDGTRADYTVTVTRAAADVSLSELTVDETPLTPDGDGNYATEVAYNVNNNSAVVTIAATATDEAGGATVAYSGTDADDMTDGHQVALAVGPNVTTVTVTAADGSTTADYDVTITRAADASLRSLTVNDEPVDPDGNGDYVHSVAFSDVDVTVVAMASDPAATVSYSFDNDENTPGMQWLDLDVGPMNFATVTVTAADGSTADYDVTITRAADASLSELTVNETALTADADDNYATAVANDVDMATIAATATDEAGGATVAYSGTDADDMTDGHQVALEVGANMFTVTVTASDGGSQDYALTVTRGDPSPAILISPSELSMGEGEEATYMIRLATEPKADVTVDITSADGTISIDGTGDLSLSTLSRTFTPSNWDRAQDVTVTAVEDDTDFDPGEFTLTHTPTSSDADYGTAEDLSVAVTDDDATGAAVTVSALTPDPIPEGDEGTFTVVLGAVPLGDVTIAITAQDGRDDDVTVSDAELTFTTEDWDQEQTVTVTADDDDFDTDVDAVVLAIVASGGGYDDIVGDGDNANDVTVNITDDDDSNIMVSPAAQQVLEGGQATFNVKLASNPGGTVNFTVTSATPATAAPSSPFLTFDENNWEMDQQVTVMSTDNEEEAIGGTSNVAITVAVVASANENGYASDSEVPDAIHTLTVVDDETAQMMLSASVLEIEQGASASYTVRLTMAPASGETVTVRVTPGAVGLNINPAVITFTDADWETPKQIDITALDTGSESEASITVTNAATSSDTTDGEYADGATSTVSVTVPAAS